MKPIAKLLAALIIVLSMAMSNAPAFAFWGQHHATQHHAYKKFGTWRGAALGALGGYAASKMTHNPHAVRNGLIGAGVGAYLGHRKRYY